MLSSVRVEADKPSTETVAGIVGEAVPEMVADLPAGSVVTGAGVAVPGLVRVADGTRDSPRRIRQKERASRRAHRLPV